MLRTGDIILFNEYSNNCIFSYVEATIRFLTNSPYSHVGIVIVDPPWAPKGTYIWDSSVHMHPDPQDNKIKYGIALVRLEDYLENIDGKQQLYKRSPKNPEVYKRFSIEKMQKIHDDVYGKHYDFDIGHWIAGFFHILIPRSTTQFFCSAFASYVLTQVGVLSPDTDWTIVSPDMLSQNGKRLEWLEEYGPDEPFP